MLLLCQLRRKGATMMRWADDWTVGLSGEITQVPAGFTHETILVSADGVTATMDYYGRKMRTAYNVNKRADPVVEKLGYWTDNGAYYYGDAYPQHRDVPGDTNPDYNLTCCTKAKLLAAKEALEKDRVAISYIQLDDWWYHGPHPVRNFHGVKCVSRWELPNNTYPGRLASLRKEYGAPFLLYGPYFCEENQWHQRLVPEGADAGVPPPEESQAFYTKVFEYLHAHGGIGYEVCAGTRACLCVLLARGCTLCHRWISCRICLSTSRSSVAHLMPQLCGRLA